MAKFTSLTDRQVRLIAKALADPRRYQILRQAGACAEGIPCSDVRECQAVTAPTLSHHIKELETAGLLTVVREGKFARLTYQRDVMKAYLEHLARV